MRLLDRYLFRELLTPLAYCLGGILILGIAGTLFNQMDVLQDHKLHLLDIVEYSIAITPEFLVTTLPLILLLGLLYALTNHARHNEITAMRAAGVGLWRVCAPYFIVGIAASVALFALNEIVVPRSLDWAKHILTRYVQKSGDMETQKPFQGFASGHRQWQFSEYRVDAAEMIRPIVFWKLKDGSTRQLHADSAAYTNGVWTFFNAAEYSQAADPKAPVVPLFETNVDVLAMPEFNETPHEIRSEMKISGHSDFLGAHAADISIKDIFDYLRLHPESRSDSIQLQLLAELHSRLAAPWTCLGVVFVAIPFGVASGRRNLFVGVAGSIAICFTYFVIQKVSITLGSGGHLPAWLAAWLPNLTFGTMGLFLMTRVR